MKSFGVAAAAVMMGMMSQQVKSFETECNYIGLGGTPAAVGVCMATGVESSSTGYMSQKFMCESGAIKMSAWTSSLSCSGTASTTLDLNGIAALYGVDSSMITWKCDGTKTVDQCAYVEWKHSVVSDELTCNTIVKYSTTPILTNVCADTSQGIALLAGCDSSASPNEIELEIFFNTDCSGAPYAGVSQGTLCSNGTKEEYTCHNCDAGQCELSDVTSAPMTTETEIETTMEMMSCPYATIRGLANALDRCAMTSNKDSTYGEKYLCDDNGQLILKRWVSSGTCSSGTVETYDLASISAMYGDDSISWMCGDASDDTCAHSLVVLYNSTTSCSELDYFRQMYLVDGVCTYYQLAGAYAELSCKDNTMTASFYADSSCNAYVFNGTSSTSCEVVITNTTTVVERNVYVSCLNDGVTTTKSGSTTTKSGSTTTKSGTTQSESTTSNPHNTSPANAFNSIWCVIVSLFFLSFMTL